MIINDSFVKFVLFVVKKWAVGVRIKVSCGYYKVNG
jgi:hypothetical protein